MVNDPLTQNQDLIRHMVSRFLAWKLPADFRPDGGITFEPKFNKEYMASLGKPPMRHEPTGTNLLDYTQATAMVGLPVLNRAPLRVPAERRALLAAIRCLRTIHEQAPVTTELTLAHEMAAQAGEALEEIGRFLTEDGEP